MSLLLIMSISGSSVIIFYCIFKGITKEKLSAKWKYRMLKIAIYFYICPVQLCKVLLIRICNNCFENNNLDKRVLLNKNIIQFSSNTLPQYSLNITYKYLYLIGIFIMSAIMLYGLVKYTKQKNNILSHTTSCDSQKINTHMKKQKEELKIKRKITCKFCRDLEPVTIGIFHPVVVLDDSNIDEKALDFILKHECLHIKNKDGLFRILAMLVLAINFYNPLAYYLFVELSSVSELVCDEEITLSLDEKERVRYCKLLFETACRKREKYMFLSNFSNRFKLKERITLVLNNKMERRVWKIFSGIIVFGVIIIVSSISTLAYAPPTILELSESDRKIEYEFDNSVNRFFVEDGGENEDILFRYFNESENILDSDTCFIDENGNKFDVDVHNRIGCTHDYVKGIYYEHVKKGTGCIYYAYNSKRCKTCGMISVGEFKSKLVYEKCPH